MQVRLIIEKQHRRMKGKQTEHVTIYRDLCDDALLQCQADLDELGSLVPANLINCSDSDVDGPLYPDLDTIYDLSSIGLPDEAINCSYPNLVNSTAKCPDYYFVTVRTFPHQRS